MALVTRDLFSSVCNSSQNRRSSRWVLLEPIAMQRSGTTQLRKEAFSSCASAMDECDASERSKTGSPYLNLLSLLYRLENGQPAPRLYKEKNFSSVALTLLAILAVAANALTLRVLLRPLMQRCHPNFGSQLVLCTWAEVLFAALSLVQHLWMPLMNLVILPMTPCGVPCAALTTTLSSLAFSAQGLRNWMMAVVTTARFETVLRPLAHLRGKLLTTRRIKRFFVVTGLLCVAHSFFLYFYPMYFVNCITNSTDGTLVTRRSTLTTVRFNALLFHFRFLPILMTVLSTLGILVVLLRVKQAHVETKANKLAAARTAAALAINFFVLEGLGCAFKSAANSFPPNLQNLWRTKAIFKIVDNYLVIANSLTNIFAFMFSNPVFRSELKNVLGIRSGKITG